MKLRKKRDVSEIDDIGEKLVSQVIHGRGRRGSFGHDWDKH